MVRRHGLWLVASLVVTALGCASTAVYPTAAPTETSAATEQPAPTVEPDKPVATQRPSEPQPTVEQGERGPDYAFPDLRGAPVRLRDFQGKVVLLNYWNLGCGPCLEELPTFNALAKKYSGQGLVVIAVHLGGPIQDVTDYVAENGYTFTVLVDENMIVPEPAVPVTYVIDRQGFVRHRWRGGPLEQDDILDELTPYLSEPE